MLLTKSQQRYPHYQKLLLAVIMTSRKVSHYFDEHPITIESSAPLADILNNPGATGRVAEWNIKLIPRDLQFKHPTSIKAEYEALLHGMRMAKPCGATRLIIYGDSNLVVQQTMRNCDALADNMAAYQKLYNTLEGSFDGCELNYISRANNTEADEFANIGSTRGQVPAGVFLESIS